MEKESIPDDCIVFRYIHPSCWTSDGRPTSGVMSDPEMSVDWDKYSTLEETARRASPSHGATTLAVAFLRSSEIAQRVDHDPMTENVAHTLVNGNKPPSIARKIAKHAMAYRVYRPAST